RPMSLARIRRMEPVLDMTITLSPNEHSRQLHNSRLPRTRRADAGVIAVARSYAGTALVFDMALLPHPAPSSLPTPIAKELGSRNTGSSHYTYHRDRETALLFRDFLL